ncbi:MAG: hypothetical protein IIZ83_01645 [Oscillospiraceae bacterium]|nr:hypothetical protein [Oscillospiraceae bacterium]
MKKTIAMVLVLILMFGLLPMAAFADNDVEDTTSVEESETVPEVTEETMDAEVSEEASEEIIEEADCEYAEAAEEKNDAVPVAPAQPEAPVAPAAPAVDGLSDEEANRLIEAYNREVEQYNAAVETYNSELEAYSQAVESFNEAAALYNTEAERFNAEAEEHNRIESEKLAAYEAEMETYNKRLDVYNKNVATIARINERNTAKIVDQMDALGSIGRVDKESILSLGTVLEEDYYKNYGRRSVQIGKAGDLVVFWDDLNAIGEGKTILVNAGEASDTTYKVANLHIFQDFDSVTEMWDYQEERGWDCMNINIDDENGCLIIPAALIDRMVMMEYEIAEVGKNDSVTVTSQTPVFDGTGLMTPRFLEGFTDGPYWANDVIFATNAMDYESDWTGTQHTFSFENGTCDHSYIKNTLNVNRYFFNRYSNPAPVEPEAFAADMIICRDLLNPLQVSLAKLDALSGIALRKITPPAPAVVPAAPVVVPAAPVKPAPVVPAAPVVNDPGEEVIEEADVPLATPVVEVDEEKAEMIAEPAPLLAVNALEEIPANEIPTASPACWALLNLIACILSVLFALASLIRRREEDDEESHSLFNKVFGTITAVCSVVLFALTENMHLAMRLTDRWTVLMFVILAISAVFFFARKETREKAVA